MYRPSFFGKASTGRVTKASFSDATVVLLFPSRGPRCVSWSFLNFLLGGAAR